MYDRKELEVFLDGDVLIENIVANQEAAYIMEVKIEDDNKIDEDHKAIIYKQILIMWFSTLEASLRGFIWTIREECRKKNCKEIGQCDYCKSKKYIDGMKFMSPINNIPKRQKTGKIDFLIDYLKDVRMIGIPHLEKKLSKLQDLRNKIHISNKFLEIDIEVFNKKTIDDIHGIIEELFYQMSLSITAVRKEGYGNGCLKELDGNEYKSTRKNNLGSKEKTLQSEKESEGFNRRHREVIDQLRRARKSK